jgi:hypothetical protein
MTDKQTTRSGVVENLGWPDRGIRIMIGTALVAVPLTIIAIEGPMNHGTTGAAWLYVALLLALYPFWTTAIGWDPVYSLFNVRTCGGSEKNPCGTLPYELDAAMGNKPIPESDIVHSLETAHHPGDQFDGKQQWKGRPRQSGRGGSRRMAAG